MLISSHANTRIKQIKSLRRREERERMGLFFIEGIRIVAEAVQLGAEIEMLVVAPELLKSEFAQEIVQAASSWQGQGATQASPPPSTTTPAPTVIEVTADVFKSISVKERPQGIGALVRQRWEALEHVQMENESYWIAVDAAQDPGNIGTILRTGDAAGSAGLMVLGNSADPYDPTALRASMGAIFSQRLVRASFDDFARWKQRHSYVVVGTSKAAPNDYRQVAYSAPLVLLMGSERQGLSREQQALCDVMVKIPMVGRSDSLNLAVATGIVLYEVFYQVRM